MTRVTIVVSIWLVMTAGIRDAVLAGGRARWPLVVLQLAASALTALALWIALDDGQDAQDDAPHEDHLWD